MTTLPTPATREDLISLLTEACELEHGLACSYLFAAFSLKQHPFEGGLTTDQLHKTKFWASQIFFVASQEMLHLAQAWNLLTAIGGTPYCLRPNLPQSSRYYPLHARVALEPFGEKALKRFIVYESPPKPDMAWVRDARALGKHDIKCGRVTIGELYGAIADGFRTIKDLFTGDPENQVGGQIAHFPDLVLVRDSASALQAIHLITHQGEGISHDRTDCHFGIFMGILKDLRHERAAGGRKFQPVRPVMKNPVANSNNGYGAVGHPVKDPLTRKTAELFDAIYFLMLQMLAFAFTPSADAVTAARAAEAAIELMTTVLLPIGDALTMLPAGDKKGLNAGPAFGLTRFIALPADPNLAVELIGERLGGLAASTEQIAADLPTTPQLPIAAARLRGIATRFAA
jgi:hypothetical protein